MKNFKKLFAIIFTVAVVVFGVLVMINEREIFQAFKNINWEDELDRGIGILAIIILVVDIFLIALPFFGFILVLLDKFDPFKAIVDSALVVLAKFLLTIFAFMLLMMVWKAPADVWKAYMFEKDSMAIVPLIIFFAALVFLMLAKFSNFEGTLTRAVLATIGSGLAIFGLVFYFILGKGGTAIGGMGKDPDWLTVMGLVVGIACFGGIIAYSYLPQTREFNIGGEKEPEAKVEQEPKEE